MVTQIFGGALRRRGTQTGPAWLDGVAVDEWVALPNSTLTGSGVGWSGTSPGGFGNYTEVVNAWGGGILNTTGIYRSGSFVSGTFMVIFGGGHGNYGGNELYAYGPLEDDSPTWSRIIDPSIPAPYDVARLDGYPVSRHTYDSLVYLPTTNQMLCISTPGYYNVGSCFSTVDVFNFDIDPISNNPWTTADDGFPTFACTNIVTGYDQTTGKAWGLGYGNAQKIVNYTVSTGTWASNNINNPDYVTNGGAGLDTQHSLLALMATDVSPRVVDLRSTPSIFTPNITGSPPPDARVKLEWDDEASRFACWCRTGKTMYFLTPGADPYSGGDNWIWASYTPSGGSTPPDAYTYGHVFGRFRKVNTETIKGFLLMSAVDGAMNFYRTA